MLSLLLDAFRSSDIIGKGVVLILLVLSSMAWHIFIAKWFTLRDCNHACKKFKDSIRNHPESAFRCAAKEPPPPTALMERIARATVEATVDILHLQDFQKYNLINNGKLPRPLRSSELERIRTRVNNTITDIQLEQESALSRLGSIISTAPMLGLFGTVWGVMATFIGIANNSGRPDMQAIAPGISGALLTTIGGLTVAIPAIICNANIVNQIQQLDMQMEDFADDLISLLALAAPPEEEAPKATATAPTAAGFTQPQPQPQPLYTQPVAPPPQPQPTYTPPAATTTAAPENYGYATTTAPQPQAAATSAPQQQTILTITEPREDA